MTNSKLKQFDRKFLQNPYFLENIFLTLPIISLDSLKIFGHIAPFLKLLSIILMDYILDIQISKIFVRELTGAYVQFFSFHPLGICILECGFFKL